MTNTPSISILVVDDEPAIREVFTHFLDRRGHKVISCGNAEEALRSADKFEFDVVILDLKLPDMSGLDLAERLREQNARSRIILLTGAPGDDTEERARKLQIYRYLSKPIRATTLIEVVESAGTISTHPGTA